MILREEAVSEKGVSAFNAKVELYNCREWLKRIRGEVDAGLQRLDLLLKNVDITRPGKGCMGKEWASKPKRTPEPRCKKIFMPKTLGVGLGLGPNACKVYGQPRSSKTTMVNPPVGLGLVVGLSGHPNGPQGVGCVNENNRGYGLDLEAGPSGFFEGDPSMEAGLIGLDAGRPGMGDSKRDGSAAWASSSRLGASGSGLSSEKVGMKDDECTKSLTKRGDIGLVQLLLEHDGKEPYQLSPAKAGKEPCLKSPVSLRLGKRAADTEPIKLQVYQRSRGRFSKPIQIEGVSYSIG